MTNSPKDSFNACEDFFLSVTSAHILGAPMHILGMGSLNDYPTMYEFPPNVGGLPMEQKQTITSTVAHDILSYQSIFA